MTQDGKTQMRDGFRTDEFPEGRPMFWHKKNGRNSYNRLNLCRSNNSDVGDQFVMIATGYFQIFESKPR